MYKYNGVLEISLYFSEFSQKNGGQSTGGFAGLKNNNNRLMRPMAGHAVCRQTGYSGSKIGYSCLQTGRLVEAASVCRQVGLWQQDRLKLSADRQATL